MSKPLTDVEKIRKLPWLIAGDSLNASYFLLTFSGSVFLLFLNEVGLNTSQIGVLLSLIPFANMIAPIVAPTIARIGVKRAFISFRAVRIAVFALLLFTPLVLARFGMNSTFIWVTAVIALFSFVRSIGETSVFPWVKEIVPNDIRGKFNAVNSISSTIVSIIIITAASWVIDSGTGLGRFTTLITLGTGLGILSLISYTQIPGGKPVHLEKGTKNFFKNLKKTFQDKKFIRFLQAIGLVTIGSSATFSFIPLFMKQNIGLSEGNVVLLNVGQYAGAILSSYMWGWLADRYGSKPIMQLSLCLLASLPIFWFFLPRNSSLSLLLAGGIAFVLGVANLAWQISWARHLYVNATNAENQSTYMAIFFAWMGFSEGLGPLLGGQLLSLTRNIQVEFSFLTINTYTFLFIFSLAAFITGLMVITSLPTEDTPSLRRFTGMFLRGNMFRALESMIQYNFAGTEEAKIVTTERMGDSQNPLSANELIEALNDPSYNVRYQAVNSIGRMPPSPELIDALIASLDDVTELNFVVTRSLGRLGDPRAIPPLRKLLFSGYHLLETNSARALAMLNDKDSIPYLLEKMRGEPNLTLRVAFATALGKLGAVESIAELSDLMVQVPKDVLRGEVGLALARIAGDERYYTQHWRLFHSNLNTAAGQAVLAFQKQARRLKLDSFVALTEACADNFARGNLPEGVAHTQQMIAGLPAENLTPALVEIMRRCAQNLATAPNPARPELLLLAFHTIDTTFQQLGSPNMDISTQNPSKLSSYLGVGAKIILPIFLARLLMDTSTRILYPFIPQISAGLGLTVLGYSWLMFIRSMVNISSPVFGVLSDRRGRRILMASALLLQAVGTGGLIIFKQWWAVLPIIISGIGIAAFYPSQQAYTSEQAHPARRGRALAAIESSWSLVGIFILPVAGWLINDFGWQAPFLALSLLCLIGISVLWFQLPPVQARQTSTRLSLAEIRAVFLKSNVLASVGVVLLIYIPVAELITIWGIWLSDNFGFSAVLIGWVATGIGLAELAGVFTSGLIIDRVGKKRSGMIGALILASGFAILPFTQTTLWAGLVVLVLISAFYEFLLVSMVPVYAEQEPAAQGTVLSLVVVGSGIGGGLGSPIATTLWNLTGDWRGISAVAVICLLLAFILIKNFLRG